MMPSGTPSTMAPITMPSAPVGPSDPNFLCTKCSPRRNTPAPVMAQIDACHSCRSCASGNKSRDTAANSAPAPNAAMAPTMRLETVNRKTSRPLRISDSCDSAPSVNACNMELLLLEAIPGPEHRPEILHVVDEAPGTAAAVVVEIDDAISEGELPVVPGPVNRV